MCTFALLLKNTDIQAAPKKRRVERELRGERAFYAYKYFLIIFNSDVATILEESADFVKKSCKINCKQWYSSKCPNL